MRSYPADTAGASKITRSTLSASRSSRVLSTTPEPPDLPTRKTGSSGWRVRNWRIACAEERALASRLATSLRSAYHAPLSVSPPNHVECIGKSACTNKRRNAIAHRSSPPTPSASNTNPPRSGNGGSMIGGVFYEFGPAVEQPDHRLDQAGCETTHRIDDILEAIRRLLPGSRGRGFGVGILPLHGPGMAHRGDPQDHFASLE